MTNYSSNLNTPTERHHWILMYYPKRLFVSCIESFLAVFGNGQEHSDIQKKILV